MENGGTSSAVSPYDQVEEFPHQHHGSLVTDGGGLTYVYGTTGNGGAMMMQPQSVVPQATHLQQLQQHSPYGSVSLMQLSHAEPLAYIQTAPGHYGGGMAQSFAPSLRRSPFTSPTGAAVAVIPSTTTQPIGLGCDVGSLGAIPPPSAYGLVTSLKSASPPTQKQRTLQPSSEDDAGVDAPYCQGRAGSASGPCPLQLGAWVSLKLLSGEIHSGEVYCVDSASLKCVVLRELQDGGRADFTVVTLRSIVDFNLVAAPTAPPIQDLPACDLVALERREQIAFEAFEARRFTIGVNVTKGAQEIFDFIHKTHPDCRWSEKGEILVMDMSVPPPYDRCIGPDARAADRIQVVLEKFQKRRQTHRQKEQLNGNANSGPHAIFHGAARGHLHQRLNSPLAKGGKRTADSLTNFETNHYSAFNSGSSMIPQTNNPPSVPCPPRISSGPTPSANSSSVRHSSSNKGSLPVMESAAKPVASANCGTRDVSRQHANASGIAPSVNKSYRSVGCSMLTATLPAGSGRRALSETNDPSPVQHQQPPRGNHSGTSRSPWNAQQGRGQRKDPSPHTQ